MGMDVSAVGGIGIIVKASDLGDEDFDGFWPEPEGMISHEVGAYQEDRIYFLGVGAEVDWNAGVSGKPLPVPDPTVVRQQIIDYLVSVNLFDAWNPDNFGLHIYPYVS